MTKKAVLTVALATTVTTGAVRGYQLLGKRYGHLLPSKERYQLPRDAQPVTVHTSIGEFTLVAASGYYTGAGIFVYAKNLVDPDAFMHQPRVTYAFPGLAEPMVPQVTPELTAAFYEATEGQFHLDLPPHTSRGGDGSAFALITAGRNEESYHSQVSGNTDPKHGNGYFKCNDAPTMRMAARTLRTIIDGSPLERTKRDLQSIAEGLLPVHTLHDLRTAKATAEKLACHYQNLAITGYEACRTRIVEIKSKD